MFAACRQQHPRTTTPGAHLRDRRPSALARLARQPPAAGRRRAACRGVDVNDLYGSYPDYAIDVEAEQARLARADLLVLLHPIQWYSMPALQKLWLDDVLAYGWAYGTGRHARCRARTAGWSRPPAAPRRATTRRATTATSSTPSCRPTSRPPRCAACASCRRWCSTARAARPRPRSTAHVDIFAERLRAIRTGPRWTRSRPARRCVVPQTDRPRTTDAIARPSPRRGAA